MNFEKRLETLIGKVKSKIKPESTAEEVEEVNDLLNDLNALKDYHSKVVEENGQFKDTIVRMVVSQGSSDKPANGSDGSKTMTIEEAVAEVSKGGK